MQPERAGRYAIRLYGNLKDHTVTVGVSALAMYPPVASVCVEFDVSLEWGMAVDGDQSVAEIRPANDVLEKKSILGGTCFVKPA